MIKGVGIGLRHKHFSDFLESAPDVPWLEVHTENFFSTGAKPREKLRQIAKKYPLSAHGVGLSLGSADRPSKEHLIKIKNFIAEFKPVLVSEHLSWSSVNGVFLNDLLPVPYTQEALDVISNNIKEAQDFLGRQILIENPSSYMAFKISTMPEDEFMNKVAEQSGCGILLDINNIYVSSVNHNFDAAKYLNNISGEKVGEIHLAGFTEGKIDERRFLLDTHSAKVFPDVWKLYKQAIKKFGEKPTLIEWDEEIPELSVLLEEREKAEKIIKEKAKKNAA